MGTEGYKRVEDVDNDGLVAIRFGGRDCDDADAAVGDCDQDRDTFRSVAFGGEDCDDTTAAVAPGQVERCDGLDNDCDGLIDDQDPDVQDVLPFYADDDADGFGAGEPVFACEAPAGFVARDDDCNDDFASIHPGEPEQCDGIDWNCDGDPLLGAFRQWFADADDDDYGDPATLIAEGCDQPPGAVDNPHDCNDNDPNAHPIGLVNPDYTEVCDGIDNDCNQLVDADDPALDPAQAFLLFPDFDGDGFGDPLGADLRCAIDPEYVDNDLDCDDTDPLARPSAPPDLGYVEICDGFDNDCNGLFDADDPGLSLDSAFLLSPDVDGDGFGAAQVAPTLSCVEMDGFVDDNTDCDDTNPDTRPFVGERCATPDDDDCDGLLGSDDPDNDGIIWFPDLDGDGVGVSGGQVRFCEEGGREGFSLSDGDCDDTNPSLTDVVLWYLDEDQDGFADEANGSPIDSCTPIPGRSNVLGDCDDTTSSVNPSAAELCNREDDNCNGVVDENAPGNAFGFLDADGDGFGTGMRGEFCEDVSPNNLDCDDTNPTVAPFAVEFCDDIDNDCDGRIDEDDPDLVTDTYYPDTDLDGFGDTVFALATCDPPPGYILEGSDCDPQDPSRYFSTFVVKSNPAASEPSEVSTLAEALYHPGSCRDDLTIILEKDAAFPTDLTAPMGETGEFVVVGELTIRGSDSAPRPTLTIPDGAVLKATGKVSLEGVDLVVDGPRSRGAIDVTADAATLVELTDVAVNGDIDGPLIRLLPGTGSLARVEIAGLTLGASQMAGVVRSPGTIVDLNLGGLVATGTTFTAPIVDAGTTPNGGLSNVRLEEAVLQNITMPAGSGPLIHVRGGFQTRVDRSSILGFAGPGPLFCIEGNVCSGDGTTADTVGPGLPSEVSLEISFSEFANITTSGTRPWFLWQPSYLATVSIANTYRDIGGGELLHAKGPPAAGVGWSSLRDRFVRHDANVLPTSLAAHFKETFFIDSVMQAGTPGGLTRLDNVAVIEGVTDLVGTEYQNTQLAVVADHWPLPPVDNLSGFAPDSLHYFPGDAPSHPCADCTGAFLGFSNLVSYQDALPLERMIPFPKNDPDSPFTFGAVSSTGAGVKWSIDPDANGLPSAWVVFHASVPECLNQIDALIDETGDPDGDLLSNLAEYEAGTWPCVADTDADGSPDNQDDQPLNAAVQ